jgi:hypothetical protein
VLLPQDSPLPRRVIRASMLLDWLMTFDKGAPRIANWNDLQLRLHQGYRLPGYPGRTCVPRSGDWTDRGCSNMDAIAPPRRCGG